MRVNDPVVSTQQSNFFRYTFFSVALCSATCFLCWVCRQHMLTVVCFDGLEGGRPRAVFGEAKVLLVVVVVVVVTVVVVVVIV